MSDDASGSDRRSQVRKNAPSLADQVGAKAARKLKKQSDPDGGVWFGLGMMGLIGWSVAVPTLLGAALGIWLDSRYPGRHSWTLALLVLGLAIGCFNAWHWVAREDRAMQDDHSTEDPGQDDV
ncbi:MAG: AtpZ/AtpI family protein [Dokdonella sp.]